MDQELGKGLEEESYQATGDVRYTNYQLGIALMSKVDLRRDSLHEKRNDPVLAQNSPFISGARTRAIIETLLQQFVPLQVAASGSWRAPGPCVL